MRLPTLPLAETLVMYLDAMEITEVDSTLACAFAVIDGIGAPPTDEVAFVHDLVKLAFKGRAEITRMERDALRDEVHEQFEHRFR